MREVRRAEPVEEPEVRRAEPAPPEEGPVEVAPDATASSQAPNSVTQPEENGNVAETAETTSRKTKQTEVEPKAVKPPVKRKEQTAISKRRAYERAYPPQPNPELEGPPPSGRGRVRARFVGVTEDGNWMLALPSNKIIVVPPPPAYR